MSDTAEDFGFDARQLLNKGKTHSLRKQMREFVSKHDSEADLRELREAVASGKALSDVVTEEREERL